MKRTMQVFWSAVLAAAVLMAGWAPGANAASSRGAGGGGGNSTAKAQSTTDATSPARFSSATLDGATGGTLVLNGWKILVPQGAWSGVATITMTEVTGTYPTVEISIDDPAKNAFNVPVQLSYKYTNAADAGDKVISWLNPATGTWIDVPGRQADDKGWVSVPLWHFSTYRTGRAGW